MGNLQSKKAKAESEILKIVCDFISEAKKEGLSVTDIKLNKMEDGYFYLGPEGDVTGYISEHPEGTVFKETYCFNPVFILE